MYVKKRIIKSRKKSRNEIKFSKLVDDVRSLRVTLINSREPWIPNSATASWPFHSFVKKYIYIYTFTYIDTQIRHIDKIDERKHKKSIIQRKHFWISKNNSKNNLIYYVIILFNFYKKNHKLVIFIKDR